MKAGDYANERHLRFNNVHPSTVCGIGLECDELAVKDLHLADVLRPEAEKYIYYLEIDAYNNTWMVVHQNVTSTLSSNAVAGGIRTETDECIQFALTMLEMITELNLSSNHVFKGLHDTDTKGLCVNELLRLRTTSIMKDGTLVGLFVCVD